MSQVDFTLDALTRHQIFVQRLAGGIRNDLSYIFTDAISDSISFIERTSRGDFILSSSAIGARQIVLEAGSEFERQLLLQLDEFAEYEAGFNARLLESVSTATMAIPPTSVLSALISTDPALLVSGRTERSLNVTSMARLLSESVADNIESSIRDGVVQGKTTSEITAEILSYAKVRMPQDVSATVLTATNHVGALARKETYKANSDVIGSEEWVSVLDFRTTITCAGLDGKIFPVGEGVFPPRHYRCRSVRIPIVKEKYRIKGIGSTRTSLGGEVGADTTYSKWLRRQSVEMQNEVLGKERAQIFRENKISIDKFIDDTGKVYTLEQLKALEGLTLQ